MYVHVQYSAERFYPSYPAFIYMEVTPDLYTFITQKIIQGIFPMTYQRMAATYRQNEACTVEGDSYGH